MSDSQEGLSITYGQNAARVIFGRDFDLGSHAFLLTSIICGFTLLFVVEQSMYASFVRPCMRFCVV